MDSDDRFGLIACRLLWICCHVTHRDVIFCHSQVDQDGLESRIVVILVSGQFCR